MNFKFILTSVLTLLFSKDAVSSYSAQTNQKFLENAKAMFACAISFNNGGAINNIRKKFLDKCYHLSKNYSKNDIPYVGIKLNQDLSAVQVSSFFNL